MLIHFIEGFGGAQSESLESVSWVANGNIGVSIIITVDTSILSKYGISMVNNNDIDRNSG